MSFCTACGKSVLDGAKFCTSCGAALSAAAADPEPSLSTTKAAAATALAMAPAEPESPATSYEPAPGGDSSSAFLIVGLALLVLIVLAVSAIFYFRGQSSKKTASPPAAAAAPSKTTGPAPNLNLANYPGSTPMAVIDGGQDVIAAFRTRDTPQQVIGFYKVRFPVSTTTGDERQSELQAELPDGQRIRVHAEQGSGGTEVHIIRDR